MYIVASVMNFKAMVDANDYQELLLDESEEVLEPEIHPARGGGHNVITIVKGIVTEEKAKETADYLSEFSYGSPLRKPQIIIRDTKAVTAPIEEREKEELPREEEKGRREEEIIPPEETPYRIAYRKTPKFRESQKRYQQSAPGREAQRRYARTVVGLERRSEYEKSDKGRARRKEHQERQKTERKTYAITNKETNEFVEITESAVRDATNFLGIESILALVEAADYSKNEAHEIFNSLLSNGNFVEVRRRRS